MYIGCDRALRIQYDVRAQCRILLRDFNNKTRTNFRVTGPGLKFQITLCRKEKHTLYWGKTTVSSENSTGGLLVYMC